MYLLGPDLFLHVDVCSFGQVFGKIMQIMWQIFAKPHFFWVCTVYSSHCEASHLPSLRAVPSARCTTYRSELALDNAADVTRRSGLDTSVSWANGVVVGRSKEASRTFISIYAGFLQWGVPSESKIRPVLYIMKRMVLGIPV